LGFFSSMKQEVPSSPPITAARAVAIATSEDQEAWTHYLAHRDPRLRKPGVSIKVEYEQWMVARVNSRVAVSANNHPA